MGMFWTESDDWVSLALTFLSVINTIDFKKKASYLSAVVSTSTIPLNIRQCVQTHYIDKLFSNDQIDSSSSSTSTNTTNTNVNANMNNNNNTNNSNNNNTNNSNNNNSANSAVDNAKKAPPAKPKVDPKKTPKTKQQTIRDFFKK
eukprot:TRINITY_DN8480_c0_g1_i1.p2 TRINITY_DN8480_c0_g1~~TRINITY_DN8480_c0_g1_i1.p2  ORF type:complete len:145 (+),score=55.59 TRINITY_DN8480_c0_g1_i1:1015-1449(+)